MSFKPSDTVILIPSLEPDDRLPAYVEQLKAGGFEHVVVVDDGSSEKYQPVFGRIAAMPGCTVLHHDVNHGKGVALKTGYKWILENLPDCAGVITADADGQHTVKDCVHLAEKVCEGERKLYLGARDFNLPNVPARSRNGNHITSAVFKVLYGQYLPDTQTGLRAFPASELQFMIDVEGERYEYEMKVLIACARAKIPMESITIETIYENNNEGSHFHPLRDSWRIYKVILGSFFMFMGASFISWLIDYALFNVLDYAVLRQMSLGDDASLIAAALARVVSATFNFVLNRQVVFKDDGGKRSTFARYAILAVSVLITSAVGIRLLVAIHVPDWLAKIVCDVLLYFVNFNVQSRWVFRSQERK